MDNLARGAWLIRNLDRWLFPLVVGGCAALALWQPGREMITLLLNRPIHALGNLAFETLTGQVSLSLPHPLNYKYNGRTVAVLLSCMLFLSVSVKLLWKWQMRQLVMVAFCLLLIQFYVGWYVRPFAAAKMWSAFSGFTIEIGLAAVMLILPFHKPSHGTIADIFRYTTFAIAGSVLGTAFHWLLFFRDNPAVVFHNLGSRTHTLLIADLQRLHSQFGWPVDQVLSTYMSLAVIAAGLVGLNYVVVAWFVSRND